MTVNIHGYEVLIDDEDFEKVMSLKWHPFLDKKTNIYFIHTINSPRSKLRLHRFVIGYSGSMIVDHKDGNTLNNQKRNLRICSVSQNNCNRRLSVKNTCGYKGVSWDKTSNRYRATIQINYKKIWIGSFATPEEAHFAYCEASRKYHGDFGREI